MLALQDLGLLSNLGLLVLVATLLGGTAFFAFLRFTRTSATEPTADVTTERLTDRLISRKEVAKHSAADDLWIILKSQQSDKLAVYDITAYVEEHPGGQAILNNAGRESTKGFFGPQHPARVFDMIEDYYIGDLEQ